MIYNVRDIDIKIELIGQVQERLPDNLKILLMLNKLSALIALSVSKPHITPVAVIYTKNCIIAYILK